MTSETRSIRISDGPLPGTDRGSDPVVHVRIFPKLVFYPADIRSDEVRNGAPKDYWLGTIYVLLAREEVASYRACGGPRVRTWDDGHIAEPTPRGHFTLGPAHHHVSDSWPRSSIPWGAAIRAGSDGEVEFNDGSGWRRATGDGAPMNRAVIRSYVLRKEAIPSREKIQEEARLNFHKNTSNIESPLVSIWERNDFGEWAFNLRSNGKRTAYYIHTTPENEVNRSNGRLNQSHGCIHIHPNIRDEMMELGYLKAGVHLEVKGYKEKGPPCPRLL